MKIWVIGRNYPDKKNNRQGSFELEQAKMLAKRGNDITYIACVLHPFWRIKSGGYVEFKDKPINVCAYSGFFTPHMTNPPIQSPYFPKLRNKRWKDLLKKAEELMGLPEVIHIHFPLLILSAEVFKEYRERGVKIVVTEHWSKVQNKQLDNYEKTQMEMFLQFANAYMAVGYSLRNAILDISGTKRKVEIMPNIINDMFRLEDRKHDGFKFGTVGRLVPAKQIDKIIATFANQFKGCKDVRLIIVGDGSQRRKLEKLTNMLGIKEQIEFKGALEREKTADIMKALDCLVCFSSYETFGVPVIEAWACGVPVITTTAENISEKWDEKLGISVNSRDINALGRAMKRMIKKREKYDRRYISEYALNQYSEETIYHRLIDIYKT